MTDRETHPLPPVTQPNELKSGGSFMNATIMRSTYKYKKCYQVKAAKCSRRAISPRLLLRIQALRWDCFPFQAPPPTLASHSISWLFISAAAFPQFFLYICVHFYIYILGRHRHEKELSEWLSCARAAAWQSVSRNRWKSINATNYSQQVWACDALIKPTFYRSFYVRRVIKSKRRLSICCSYALNL